MIWKSLRCRIGCGKNMQYKRFAGRYESCSSVSINTLGHESWVRKYSYSLPSFFFYSLEGCSRTCSSASKRLFLRLSHSGYKPFSLSHLKFQKRPLTLWANSSRVQIYVAQGGTGETAVGIIRANSTSPDYSVLFMWRRAINQWAEKPKWRMQNVECRI